MKTMIADGPLLKNRLPTVCLFVLTLMLSHSYCLAQARVYKHTDKDGKVTFSDQQTPGAETIEIRKPNTSDTPESTRPDHRPPSKKPPPGYTTFLITTPENDAVIPNGLVPFTVSTAIEPALAQGHSVQLLLDGQLYDENQNGSFTVLSVTRGQHTLQANIVAPGNKTLKQSPVITIFAYRPGK